MGQVMFFFLKNGASNVICRFIFEKEKITLGFKNCNSKKVGIISSFDDQGSEK